MFVMNSVFDDNPKLNENFLLMICFLLVESEGVYEPGPRQEDGQEVTGGEGQEDSVGR